MSTRFPTSHRHSEARKFVARGKKSFMLEKHERGMPARVSEVIFLKLRDTVCAVGLIGLICAL